MAKALKRKQKCIEPEDLVTSKKRVSRNPTADIVDQSSGQSKYFLPGLQSGGDVGTTTTVKTLTENSGGNTTSNSAGLSLTANRLAPAFYEKSCVDLARSLLGQILVRKLEDGTRVAGRIVETEAYCGIEDKAAHSYKGKRTEKTEAMFMKPGTAYVYNIYGMYCCINISSQGEGCAVLLRAVEPVEGFDTIASLRSKGKKSPGKTLKNHQLANGPSKICMALGIKKVGINKQDMSTSDCVWLENGEDVPLANIVTTTRINISYGEDWIDKPLRFYILDNTSVSVRDKVTEKDMREKLQSK